MVTEFALSSRGCLASRDSGIRAKRTRSTPWATSFSPIRALVDRSSSHLSLPDAWRPILRARCGKPGASEKRDSYSTTVPAGRPSTINGSQTIPLMAASGRPSSFPQGAQALGGRMLPMCGWSGFGRLMPSRAQSRFAFREQRIGGLRQEHTERVPRNP